MNIMRASTTRRMPTALGALGLAASAWLAACSSDSDHGAARAAAACAPLAALSIPGSGSAASHGEAQRTDGPVVIRRAGTAVVAQRIVTLVNDFGGAQAAQIALSSPNGNITNCVRGEGGYGTQVVLEARAATESAARQALDTMVVMHSDRLLAGTLNLSTSVEYADPPANTPLPGTGATAASRRADILMGMPSAPAYALQHEANNGELEVLGFAGTEARLQTNNGNVFLDGRWNRSQLQTNNGIVEVVGDHADLLVATSNGLIAALLETRRSSSAQLSNTNGEIEVVLRRSGTPAFDLMAQTTNGQAQIAVAGTAPVGPQSASHQHHRSPGFETSAHQVQISAQSTNGGVRIRD